MSLRHVSIFSFIATLNLTVESLQLLSLKWEKNIQMVERQQNMSYPITNYWDKRQMEAQAEIASGELQWTCAFWQNYDDHE
jgi:hypothetical protein